MKTLGEFLNENKDTPSPYTGKDDHAVHKDLLKAGLTQGNLGYKANHSHDKLHKILSKHGYKPVTNYYSDGKPMPKPYSVYEKESPPYTTHRAAMQIKDGKVTHIRTDTNVSRD